MHAIDKVGEPFHEVHLKHLGPIVRSKAGSVDIVEAADAFTKFVIMRTLINISTCLTKAFLHEIDRTFCTYKMIITDRRTSFIRVLFEKYGKYLKISYIKKATVTPGASEQVGRYNCMTTLAIDSFTRDTKGRYRDEADPQCWVRHKHRPSAVSTNITVFIVV